MIVSYVDVRGRGLGPYGDQAGDNDLDGGKRQQRRLR